MGGPCEDRLAMRLWLFGIMTVGDRWEPQTHLSNISQTFSLGCPGLEGFVGARTQGLRIGYEERAEFSDPHSRLILSGYAGGDRPARHCRDIREP